MVAWALTALQRADATEEWHRDSGSEDKLGMGLVCNLPRYSKKRPPPMNRRRAVCVSPPALGRGSAH